MIGKFLELSLATPDIRESLAFYGRLGFSEAEVGEAWAHPYAVVTDGRVCFGLHQSESFATSLTFVRPDLLKHLDSLERLGVHFEFRRLADDAFNEAGFFDPSNHLVRLVEARTFSPSKRPARERSRCGYFMEIAIPTAALRAAQVFWERVGFIGLDELAAPLPHVSCTSDTIDIGLYEPPHIRELTVCFETDDIARSVKDLTAAGAAPHGRVPAPLGPSQAVVLTAPEGTRLLLTTPVD